MRFSEGEVDASGFGRSAFSSRGASRGAGGSMARATTNLSIAIK
jgi:hypothetical protein